MKKTILNNTGAVYANYYKSSAKLLAQTINDGLINNLSKEEINNNIDNLVTGLLSSRAQSVAQTSTNAMANNAKIEEYKENKIERVKWVLSDEHQDDDECDDNDGEIWDIDDAIQPPIHYNCKCTLEPVDNND